MGGGLSGRPGRGSDAGSIEIHFVNSQPSQEERSLLILAASAEGGVPAQSHRQRTSSFAQLQALQNRSAFIDEVAIPDLDKLSGTSGTIAIDAIDTDQAIRAIHGRLLEAEIAGNYAIDRPHDGPLHRSTTSGSRDSRLAVGTYNPCQCRSDAPAGSRP